MPRIITKYDFDSTKVSSILYEDYAPGFVWVAFEAEPSTPDQCRLIRASTFNLNSIMFDFTVPVDRINKMVIASGRVVLAVDHDTLMGYRYYTTFPITSFNSIAKPVAITENPVDIIGTSSRLYFLFPGSATGTNAKIAITDSVGNHLQTVDLIPSATGGIPVTDASGMIRDLSGDIWVVTNTSPVRLVRVYDTGGEVFDVQSHQII